MRIHRVGERKRLVLLLEGLLVLLACTSVLWGGALVVRWDSNTENDLAGYLMYYGDESRVYDQNVDVGLDTFYTVDGLTEGQTYYFAVTAYDSSGNESAFSEEVYGIVPVSGSVEVTNLIAEYREGEGLELSWSGVTGLDYYEVNKAEDPLMTSASLLAQVQSPIAIDPDYEPTPGMATYYQVKAVSNDQALSVSETFGVYALPIHKGMNLVSIPLIPRDSSLSGIFGSQLHGSNTLSESDRIYRWDGQKYEIAWLVDTANSELDGRWADQSGQREYTERIDPTESFWIHSTQDSIEYVLIQGTVLDQSEVSFTLSEGLNYVGMPYAVPTPYKNSELWEDQVVRGSNSLAQSDRILRYDNNSRQYQVAWLVDNVGTQYNGSWMHNHEGSASEPSFFPGQGYILWIRDQRTSNTWTFPNPMVD